MNSSTALHLSAAGGYGEVVKVLLEAGADMADENGVSTVVLYRKIVLPFPNNRHFLEECNSFATGLWNCKCKIL